MQIKHSNRERSKVIKIRVAKIEEFELRRRIEWKGIDGY